MYVCTTSTCSLILLQKTYSPIFSEMLTNSSLVLIPQSFVSFVLTVQYNANTMLWTCTAPLIASRGSTSLEVLHGCPLKYQSYKRLLCFFNWRDWQTEAGKWGGEDCALYCTLEDLYWLSWSAKVIPKWTWYVLHSRDTTAKTHTTEMLPGITGTQQRAEIEALVFFCLKDMSFHWSQDRRFFEFNFKALNQYLNSQIAG